MNFFTLPAFILLTIIAGCTSLADKDAMTKRAELNALNVQESAATLIGQLEPELAKQHSANMPFYAPLHWNLARDSFADAVKLHDKNAPEAEVKKQLLIVKDCIDAMPLSKKTALQETADVREYFKYLQKIEADKAYPADYAKLINDVRDVLEKMDVPDLAAARNLQQSLLSNMLKLEVKTITYQQISLADMVLAKAKYDDADDIAGQSFRRAELALKQAKNIISENPRNSDAITPASVQAMIEASHAGAVAREVKSITTALDNVDIEEETLEGVVLRFEASLSTVALSFGIADIRYLALSDQAYLLADYARALTAGNKKTIELPVYINKNYPPVAINAASLILPPDY